MYKNLLNQDTICALATPPGRSAIAVIRVSGKNSINIVSKIFSTNINKAKSHTIKFGTIQYNNTIIDEVLLSIFRSPNSFTGEDTVEISCHGSPYITNKIIQILLSMGCRLAKPGEFSLRAFINGKIDLSQAEAINELILSDSEQMHRLAIEQLRGGYSKKLSFLKNEILNFASLLELELDFSEEDIEFVNRKELLLKIDNLLQEINNLLASFEYGNAIKKGVNVVITGKANVGKSTLLNALINEEKAIVSDIPGTTRDVVEDIYYYKGIAFRFIDTAGIRKSLNKIENIGIKKTIEKISSAKIVLFLTDKINIENELKEIYKIIDKIDNEKIIYIINKIDLFKIKDIEKKLKSISSEIKNNTVLISAKNKINLDVLKEKILMKFNSFKKNNFNYIITNNRHYEALKNAKKILIAVKKKIKKNLFTELIAYDIKNAANEISVITGEISSEDILNNIFSKFCIGK